MKVTKLELFHISIPFITPYKLSKKYGTISHPNAVIFKLHTDEGIIGLGEADPHHPFTDETPSMVLSTTRDIIAPLILGKDPRRIGTLEAEMDTYVQRALLSRGAVNMALYDIAGKALNVPAHTLLGGQIHDKIPLFGAIGNGNPDEDRPALLGLLEQGHKTVMIKMGVAPISEEIKRVQAAQEYLGDILLIVDANQGWELSEALQFVEKTKAFAPDLLEQPISRYNFDGMKRVFDRMHYPLSADESLVSVNDAKTLVQRDVVDVFSIKVTKNGGITKGKKIAQIAEVFGKKCLMNSMLEFGVTQAASLQLGCTLPNLMNMGHAYGSVLRMSDDVTDFGENIENAVVTVPKGPGLGVTIDDDKLKKYCKNYLEIQI